MNIVVIKVNDIVNVPPAISLVNALLDLGHNVALLAGGVGSLPSSILDRDGLTGIELGKSCSKLDTLKHLYSDHKMISDYLNAHKNEIDLVWTTTDMSARAVGNDLLNFNYVLQISELVEYVPLLRGGASRLHYDNFIKLAQRASRVVVPEYNRAHIQQALWELPETPKLLPNKPYPNSILYDSALPPAIDTLLKSDNRKKLLYQGIYSRDRNLDNYAKAVNLLGDDYALCIMGKPMEPNVDWFRDLREITDQVVDLGFVAAPNHLSVTPFGYIGLLPYRAERYAHYSVLNALYCAPNKIWEYSRFGLPMIGSDVPGLTAAFRDGKMGFTVDGTPEGIANAVIAIDEDYDDFSKRSKQYYDSIDFKQIVSEILDEAMR